MLFYCLLILCIGIGHVSAIETVKVAGWDKMVPIIQNAADSYSQSHPGVSIVVTGTDSSSALRLLSDGSIDIALGPDIESSTGPDNAALKKYLIGRTAYVFIVNSDNPVSKLSAEDIRDIFHNEKKNWKFFGGVSGAILTVGKKASANKDNLASGHTYFKSILEERETRLPAKVEMNSNLDILKVISNDPTAIGYTEYKYIDPDFSFNPKSQITPVSVQTDSSVISPSLDTIISGEYPFVENLNVYTGNNPDPKEQDFIGYLLSNEGQSYVKSNGQCPVIKDVKVIRTISAPQKILAPGYYFLDRDLNTPDIIQLNDQKEAAFIVISSNAVTFDGMGHTIDCTEADKRIQQIRIASEELDPVKTISPQQNGYLMRAMGFSAGYQGPDYPFTNLTIKNVTVTNCKVGVDVIFYQNPVIENVTLINNWKGIYFFTSTNQTLSNCNFIGNTEKISSTNSGKTAVKGNNTGSIDVKQYQMADTPYNMNTPLPALDMSFVFFLIFLPKLLPKVFEGVVDYINERFFAPKDENEREKKERYIRVFQHWIAVSVIAAIVLAGGFYYAYSPAQFEISAAVMFLIVGSCVVISHEVMHYFAARRYGMDVKFRLWNWGIIVIIISSIMRFTIGQPVFIEFDEEKADIRKQALVMLSRPFTTIILSLPFVILFLQNETNSEYAFLLLEISVVTSLIAFMPLSPLDGEKVFKWNRWVWLTIFAALFASFLAVNWIIV